ncbi:MAG: DnaJ domain-containing protein [bacterium]
MLDDSLLLMQKQDVDYRSLTGSPSPEEFFLLSRVKGTVSVAQICSVSGFGKEKTLAALERLLEFGLLVPASNGAGPSVSTPEQAPVRSAPVPQPQPAPVRPTAPSPQPVAARQAPEPIIGADDDDLFGGAPAAAPQPAAKSRADSHGSFVPVVEARADDLFEADSPVFGGSSRPARSREVQSPSQSATQMPARPVAPSEPEFVIEHTAHVISHDDADDELFGGARQEPRSEAVEAPRVSLFDDEAPPVAAQPAPRAQRAPTEQDIPEVVGLCRVKIGWDDFVPDPTLMALDVDIDELRKREILFMYENMELMSYYELFGVDEQADRREVKKAYITLSKRYHPDLFFRKDVGEFGVRAESLFKWVTKAFQTLQNPQKKDAYDAELAAQHRDEHQSGLGSEASEARKEEAYSILIGRAQRLERAGDFSGAVDEYRNALSFHRDTNVILRCANLLLRAGIRLDEAAMYARALLGYDPNHLEGLVVLGNIYERNGMLEDALDAYERAVSVSGGDASVVVHAERVRVQMAQ